MHIGALQVALKGLILVSAVGKMPTSSQMAAWRSGKGHDSPPFGGIGLRGLSGLLSSADLDSSSGSRPASPADPSGVGVSRSGACNEWQDEPIEWLHLRRLSFHDYAVCVLRTVCGERWFREKLLREDQAIMSETGLMDKYLSGLQTRLIFAMLCHPDPELHENDQLLLSASPSAGPSASAAAASSSGALAGAATVDESDYDTPLPLRANSASGDGPDLDSELREMLCVFARMFPTHS